MQILCASPWVLALSSDPQLLCSHHCFSVPHPGSNTSSDSACHYKQHNCWYSLDFPSGQKWNFYSYPQAVSQVQHLTPGPKPLHNLLSSLGLNHCCLPPYLPNILLNNYVISRDEIIYILLACFLYLLREERRTHMHLAILELLYLYQCPLVYHHD